MAHWDNLINAINSRDGLRTTQLNERYLLIEHRDLTRPLGFVDLKDERLYIPELDTFRNISSPNHQRIFPVYSSLLDVAREFNLGYSLFSDAP